jgi:hypothetical protein
MKTSLAVMLQGRLNAWREALELFAWPNDPIAESKLVRPDPKRKGLFSASIPPEATPPRRSGYASLQGLGLAHSGTYHSDVFDPGAANGLAVGSYGFTVQSGQGEESLQVRVVQDEAWEEVVRRSAFSPDALVKDSADWKDLVNEETLGLATSSVTDETTWEDLRAVLTRDSAVVRQDATFTDTLNALASEIGMRIPYVSAAVSDRERTDYGTGEPLSASGLFLELSVKNPAIGDRLRLHDTDGLLAALGMEKTAVPGSDAVLMADGQTHLSASDSFLLDQDRIRVDLKGLFGEPLSLHLEDGLPAVRRETEELLAAYSDLVSFVSDHAGLLVPDLDTALREPAQENIRNLADMGIKPIDRKGSMGLEPDLFERSLTTDSDGVRRVLCSRLQTMGAENLIRNSPPETEFEGLRPAILENRILKSLVDTLG